MEPQLSHAPYLEQIGSGLCFYSFGMHREDILFHVLGVYCKTLKLRHFRFVLNSSWKFFFLKFSQLPRLFSYKLLPTTNGYHDPVKSFLLLFTLHSLSLSPLSCRAVNIANDFLVRQSINFTHHKSSAVHSTLFNAVRRTSTLDCLVVKSITYFVVVTQFSSPNYLHCDLVPY